AVISRSCPRKLHPREQDFFRSNDCRNIYKSRCMGRLRNLRSWRRSGPGSGLFLRKPEQFGKMRGAKSSSKKSESEFQLHAWRLPSHVKIAARKRLTYAKIGIVRVMSTASRCRFP